MNRFLRVLCVLLWLAFAGWVGTIFYLSSLTGSNIEELNVFHLWDKLAHSVAFGAGGFLLAAGLRVVTSWPRTMIYRRTLLAIALYAASDEWHQLYTPGRSGADVGDWLADVIGASVGAGIVVAWRARRPAVAKDCEIAPVCYDPEP